MKSRLILSILAMFLLFQSAALAVTIRDAVFTTNNLGKVVFSHGNHLNKKGLTNNCQACHDALFDLKKKKQHSMAEMGKGKSCGACHDGKKAFSLGECARCHQTKEIVYNVKATGATGFSHKLHLAKSADCSVCHPSVFAAGHNKRFTMEDMKKGKSCGACHNGKKTFSIETCAKCHPVKEITFEVKQTGPTLFSHKKHIEVADCDTCHPKLYSPNQKNKPVGMAAMAKGKSCGACHNGKKAFGIDTCATCHPVKEITYKVKETGPTQFSHKIHLEVAECGKCHPKLYAPNQKNRRVGMTAMEKGKSCGACHNSKQAFSVKECSKCHPVRELVFEDKDAGNVTFSHKFHTGLYACADCHISLYETARSKAKVTMQEMEKGKSCGGCHEGKTAFSVKGKCEACHKL